MAEIMAKVSCLNWKEYRSFCTHFTQRLCSLLQVLRQLAVQVGSQQICAYGKEDCRVNRISKPSVRAT